MPNEQVYLDRDAFDLYNPVPDCNMEHFFACSSMPGDIGMKKRIWETNRLFARKWYVWDSDHRTLTTEEFQKYGEDLIRYSDYCYYPTPHEWAVMRADPINYISYANNNGITCYVHEFLQLHTDYDIGLEPDCTTLSWDSFKRLLTEHLPEWIVFVNRRLAEDTAKQTEWMKSINLM